MSKSNITPTKPNFWKRMEDTVRSLDKSETDFLWDAIHQTNHEMQKLQKKVEEISRRIPNKSS